MNYVNPYHGMFIISKEQMKKKPKIPDETKRDLEIVKNALNKELSVNGKRVYNVREIED